MNLEEKTMQVLNQMVHYVRAENSAKKAEAMSYAAGLIIEAYAPEPERERLKNLFIGSIYDGKTEGK